jgi:hypothetical protein
LYYSPKYWHNRPLKSVLEFSSFGRRAYRTERIGRTDGPELVAPAADLFTAWSCGPGAAPT